jgi:hypothetical protein
MFFFAYIGNEKIKQLNVELLMNQLTILSSE